MKSQVMQHNVVASWHTHIGANIMVTLDPLTEAGYVINITPLLVRN